MSTTLRQFDAKSWAEHYARRHYQTDPGITDIYYLPDGAPIDVIRLVEVNSDLAELRQASSEALTMGVDIGGECPHHLSIVDVTPNQWSQIESRQLPLPAGWSLNGVRKLPRD